MLKKQNLKTGGTKMKSEWHFKLSHLRNIGIIAHIDAGKTTTTEKMLFHSGRVHRSGGVDDGTTVTDWMDQERERGITIVSAATTFQWRDLQITLIDTPGHVDFTMEVERSLRVLDGVVGVFCAVGGVQPQSETVWRQADRYQVPRIAYVNKMDRVGADFAKVVGMMRSRLNASPCPIQLPVGQGEAFSGIIDLVNMELVADSGEAGRDQVRAPVPEALLAEAEAARQVMVEQLADLSEEVMTLYLEEKEIPAALLRRVLRRETLAGRILPVLCGSSFRDRGIPLLLDAVCDFLPAPIDLPPVIGTVPDDEERQLHLSAAEAEHFSGLVFKVTTDPYVGRLYYLRIYSGRLEAGAQVYNTNRSNVERPNRILRMHGNRSEDLAFARAGEIVALVGLKTSRSGDTLCERKKPVILGATYVPEPVVSVALEPKTRADSTRLSESLAKLAEEDPTFRVSTNGETGETIISGMGELHLEIICDRLRREFRVDARVSQPQVSFRETIRKTVECEGRLVRQTGGRGQYGHVWLRLEPLPRGSGVVFEEKIKGQDIPSDYFPAIEAGVREAAETGVAWGYPVIDLKVTLFDGSYHPVDSSDIAFRVAASLGFREAVRKAKPVVLEPIMKIEVTTPEEFLGDVLGDFNSRRGRVRDITEQGNLKIISGSVPLAHMFGYATTLRSLTQGRAAYVMEPSHYEPAPEEAVRQNGSSG